MGYIENTTFVFRRCYRDILDFARHLQKLGEVFEMLQYTGLKLKSTKTMFKFRTNYASL